MINKSQVEPGALACRSPSISLELGTSLDESQLLRDKISRLQQEREHLSSQVSVTKLYMVAKLMNNF